MLSLALKYRPKTVDEIVGQKHLLALDAPFRKLVEANALPHSLFFGPAGSGKTTLARVLAKKLDYPFYEFNATTLKIDELRRVFNSYSNALQKPLIFIDEIHRLSKTQQEVLLPYMEEQRGLILGASTQNPYYALSSAIRSRSLLFELKAINKEAMNSRLTQILEAEQIEIELDAKEYLIHSSSGDLRAMLGLLDSARAVEQPISINTLHSLRPQAIRAGSSESDSHYELTSAMIKSIRGSDIDASLYWLARLIEGGEPPEFLARRLAILASEDIGNANPNALNLASSTLNIVEHIGYPEAKIPLAQLTIYLASSPKSNSAYKAINKAQKLIKEEEIVDVPRHLKQYSKEYLYPHNFGGWVRQSYIPKHYSFYEGGNIAYEKRLKEWLERITRTTKG